MNPQYTLVLSKYELGRLLFYLTNLAEDDEIINGIIDQIKETLMAGASFQ